MLLIQLKAILNPKMKIVTCSSSCCSNLYAFIFIKYMFMFHRIMLITKKFWFPFTFSFFVHSIEINGNQNYSVTNILQNIFLTSTEESQSYKFRTT